MSIELIIIITILFIVAMAITFFALKQEENKMKKYREEEEDSVQAELKRSLDYEETSVKTYIPIQIWIYLITIILSILIVVFYVFK